MLKKMCVYGPAQGDHTARPEMASGLSQYSALLSLLQMTVVQVVFSLPWFNWVTVWTRCCPLISLAVDVRRSAQFGVGLPTFSISSSLAHLTLCQCPLSGLSVYSIYLLSLNISARISSCEVLESLVRCAQTSFLCSLISCAFEVPSKCLLLSAV